MKEPATLRDAFALYKEGKFLRKDMIGRMVDEIEALQKRIGSVDEAAVTALGHRMASVETTIGNALARTVVPRMTPAALPPRNGEGPAASDEPWSEPAKRRGRPPKATEAVAGE